MAETLAHVQLFGQRARSSRHRDLPVRASVDLEIADAGPELLGQEVLDAALEFRPGPGTHETQGEPGVEFEPILIQPSRPGQTEK